MRQDKVPLAQGLQQTTCAYCGVGCGIELNVEQGQLTDLVGQRDHPANFGRLCIKGSSLLETNHLKGRLLQPKIDGQVVEWSEATAHVAQRFQQIIQKHGSDSVAFYVSGQLLTEDYYVANKLMKGYIGAANIETNSRLCMSSAVAGYQRAFGADAVPTCYQDLEQTDLILLVGANTAWTHPVLYQRIAHAKARNPNLKVVLIDPRNTATSDLADLHLPLKSGTDNVLFLGLLSYLVAHQACDQDYIAKHTEGFSQLTAVHAHYMPADVAALCDLPVEQIEMLYQWFAKAPRAVSFYSQGVNQSHSGVDNSNAIINCHLATGKIGKVGSGPFSITGQPNAMGGREVGGLSNMLAAHMTLQNVADRDRVKRFWDSPTIADKAGYKAVALFERMAKGEIKAIWVMGTNPLVSMPNRHKIEAAMKRCEFVVVSDCVAQNDTIDYADVLLPAAPWSEKNGTVTNSERCISRQRNVLPCAGQAKPDWEIISLVAQQMGFAAGFDYQHPHQIFTEHAALSGFENQQTRIFDIRALSQLTEQEYDELKPIQWPVNQQHPQGCARLFSDGKFYTASGKAQFITIKAPVLQSNDRTSYPLVLNSGRLRDQWHTMTRTGLAAKLNQHRDKPMLSIHPADATAKQLKEGEFAHVQSAQGQLTLAVTIDDKQRQGELFVPMHWSQQFASSASIARLSDDTVDPISGQPAFKSVMVDIEPAQMVQYIMIYSREALKIEQGCWSQRVVQHGFCTQIALDEAITEPLLWLQQQIGIAAQWQSFSDPEAAVHRLFATNQAQLHCAMFVSDRPLSIDQVWLDQLFEKNQLSESDRLQIMLGQAPQSDGKLVCSCFRVHEKTIQHAIQAGHHTVEALGNQLQCGTNCGSCRPELAELIQCEQAKLARQDAEKIAFMEISE